MSLGGFALPAGSPAFAAQHANACFRLKVAKIDALGEDPQTTLVRLAHGADNRLAKHFADLEAYKAKYEQELQTTPAKNGVNPYQQRGYKSKVTEAVGEIAAAAYIEKLGNYEMVAGFAPGTGFDQVYVRRGDSGFIEEVLIVEAKGPGATLSTDAEKGIQMGKVWVRHTAEDMTNSAISQDLRDLGAVILQSLKGGPPRLRGRVLQATDAGVAVQIECPNRCQYN